MLEERAPLKGWLFKKISGEIQNVGDHDFFAKVKYVFLKKDHVFFVFGRKCRIASGFLSSVRIFCCGTEGILKKKMARFLL